MKIHNWLYRWIIASSIFSGLGITWCADGTTATPASCLAGSGWSLLPPLLAIFTALCLKRVYIALAAGILLGAGLASGGNCLSFIRTLLYSGLYTAIKENLGIMVFLGVLGTLVALIHHTGATAAFGLWVKEHIKTRKGIMLSTGFLGVIICIDDYFNCLALGTTMQPLTDSQRISRAKLAYLIDSTAAPICMIAPVSSWAAAIAQYAGGTQYSGIELFVRAIPYNFYSFMTILFLFGIIFLNVDYGPMTISEQRAILEGELGGIEDESEKKSQQEVNPDSRIRDIVLPIVFMLIGCIGALLYLGGYWNGKSFCDAFSSADSSIALPAGGFLALIASVIYLWLRHTVAMSTALRCVPIGFKAMLPAILILIMATALKNMAVLLDAPAFVAHLMSNSAPYLHNLLPALIFVTATFMSFSTGASWGTFGILLPMVINLFPATSPLLLVGISACLAGAVCGDHCSPISDTTIMSSASAQCGLMEHVSTQLPYALTVAAVSLVGFILSGIIKNWLAVFSMTTGLMIAILLGIKFMKLHQRARQSSCQPR